MLTINKSKFHASIIKFNNVGMILNPISWLRANWFVKRYIKKISNNTSKEELKKGWFK